MLFLDNKPEDTPLPTISVNDGNWVGTDGTELGSDPKQNRFAKYTSYDSKVTVETTKDIDNPAFSGDVFMTDDNGDGPFTQSPYKLVTTDIKSVSGLDLKTEYYQKSYPRPAITDLGTRFNPKFDWNHSELRDHNSGNLIDVGDVPGDPKSGCTFLVYFPGEKHLLKLVITIVPVARWGSTVTFGDQMTVLIGSTLKPQNLILTDQNLRLLCRHTVKSINILHMQET